MLTTGRWIKSRSDRNRTTVNSQISKMFSRNLTILCSLLALCALLFFLPSYYFIHQNYKLFSELAFDQNPQLVQHLERESSWIMSFLFISFAAFCIACYTMTKAFFKQMISPIIEVETHMKSLSKGYWSDPLKSIDPEHDLQSFYSTYDYFYRTLKVSAEQELDLIEKMIVDPQHREAFAARTTLLDIKRKRLGVTGASTPTQGQVVTLQSRIEEHELKKLALVKKVS